MNYSTTEAYLNNNNLLRLRSSQLAKSYTAEFEEMFSDYLFGPDISPATSEQDFTIDGTRLELYFAPEDHPARRLVELIREADQSIYFLAYSFTSDELADAILESAQKGVSIAGVFEASQVASNIGTDFDRLHEAGIDVHLDGNERNMHHKVIILDEQIVITGSYNFSSNAETRNDENLVIVHNPELAQIYLQEFQKILAEAQE
ncbi:MAG: phospholipase D family protein [Anaerolineales bacterium]|nr:phospholipase D family protein [Anaerolineales bacterium]